MWKTFFQDPDCFLAVLNRTATPGMGIVSITILLRHRSSKVTTNPKRQWAQPCKFVLTLSLLLTACGTPADNSGLGIATQTTAPATSSAALAPATSACNGRDPRANVYHPNRLRLLEPCKTVTGVVAFVRREPDGDYHIGLRLDPGQEGLLNAKNNTEQSGALIVEIICANPVTQADAISACATYHNTLSAPTVGSHISATGPYVLDLDHGWNEIHPVYAIEAQAAAGSPGATVTRSAAPVVTFTAAPGTTTASQSAIVLTAAPSATVAPSQASAPPAVAATTAPPVALVTPESSVAPTFTPTTAPGTVAPTSVPATPAPTQLPATTAPNLCGAPSNPWGYNFCGGNLITVPPSNFCSYFNCIASFWNGVGYVIQCLDLTFSKSGGRSGACSQHGGNYRALYSP